MASGSFVCSVVVDEGGGDYLCTVDASAGVSLLDHVLAELSTDVDAVYQVKAGTGLPDATHVRLTDTLTEGNADAVYGAPVAGTFYYETPAAGLGLTKAPQGTSGWRALCERNFDILDGRTGLRRVQTVEHVRNDTGTITSEIPEDDTTPQSNEGTQILTKAITPQDAASTLRIEVQVHAAFAASGGGAELLGITLFESADASAKAMAYASTPAFANSHASLSIVHEVTAGGTSEQTWNVNLGTIGGAVAVALNGTSAGRLFGATVRRTYLRITEWRP